MLFDQTAQECKRIKKGRPILAIDLLFIALSVPFVVQSAFDP